MADLMKGVSVVVPCHNSSGTIEELVRRIKSVLDARGTLHEIILVNDGSSDDTWPVIRKMADLQDGVRAVNLMRNYGQHNALLCGIRRARFELVATMDDDLQHPPESLPLLLDSLDDKTDLLYGAASERVHGLLRNFGSFCIKAVLALIMNNRVASKVSAFRLFRTELRKSFEDYNSHYVSIDVLLSWGTKKISFVETPHDVRKVGRSTYSLSKLVSHAFDMLTGFSAIPLRIASITGFACMLFGLGVLIYVLARFVIAGGSIPGFPFLASIISIFAGVQLFALGIIGEYIARIHSRSMNHPAYSVKEECGARGDKGEGRG